MCQPKCYRGILSSGVFREKDTGREIFVRLHKGIPIPENKEIYIQLIYGVVAVGYVDI